MGMVPFFLCPIPGGTIVTVSEIGERALLVRLQDRLRCFELHTAESKALQEHFRAAGRRVAVVAGALVLSFVATLIALRPLARILVTPTPLGRRDLVGRPCTVITLRVDEKFGQAEIDHLPIQVEVRAAASDGLRRGSRALVFDYDESREVFLIAPLAEELAEPSS